MDELQIQRCGVSQVASDSQLSEREMQAIIRAWREELRRERWDAAFRGLVSGLNRDVS